MGKEQFLGAWRLVSYVYQNPKGETKYPMGTDASGILIYTNKHVAVQIVAAGRPPFATDSRLKGTPDEIKPAFDGYIAYYGTYSLDEKNSIIMHAVQGSLYPNWIGMLLTRSFEFSGNRLILKPASASAGSEILTWERSE